MFLKREEIVLKFIKPSVLILLIANLAPAQAASFNCMSAHSLVEHTICSSQELAGLDDLMADLYKSALASSEDAAVVQGAQRRWITERNKCTNVGCLVNSYHSRIWTLLPPHERGERWVSGVYEARGNRLDIIQTKSNEIRLRLFAISSTGNMGELEGNGQIYDGVAKYVDKRNECNLTLHIKTRKVVLSQAGYCGFGMNVVADGEYRLVEGKSPIVREYRAERIKK